MEGLDRDDVEEGIRQLLSNLENAWSAGDARAWVAEHAWHCVVINMLGQQLAGYEENERWHAEMFTGVLRGSRLRIAIERVRYPNSSNVTAVVDATATLSAYRTLPAGVQDGGSGTLHLITRFVLEHAHVRPPGYARWWSTYLQMQPILGR